jgi:hypothetical protein
MDQFLDSVALTDISPDEDMPARIWKSIQVLHVTSISERVQVDDRDIFVVAKHVVDKIRTNKSSSASNQQFFYFSVRAHTGI